MKEVNNAVRNSILPQNSRFRSDELVDPFSASDGM